jgi:16S rRNA G1207 methylase RsmC
MRTLRASTSFIVGLNLVMALPLRADSPDASGNAPAQESAHLKRHEQNLERMEADRSLDNEHTRNAKAEFRKGTAEMSGDDEQQLRNVQDLRSVENQVTAGKEQKTLARQSYKEAVQKYGSDDPRSAAAKESWKESQQALDPLLQSRQTLKEDIHEGRRLLHNDKTVLSVQKRDMASDARYRAIDDRKIQKEEKNIADDRSAMTQNVRSPEPPGSK